MLQSNDINWPIRQKNTRSFYMLLIRDLLSELKRHKHCKWTDGKRYFMQIRIFSDKIDLKTKAIKEEPKKGIIL